MGSRGLAATVAVASVLLIAGCTTGGTRGSDPGPTEAASLSYAHGATDLVVQARSGGGLLPPSLRLAEMPDVSIYGDGRVVLLGSHSSGAESPLLPVLSETRVTPEAMTQILAAARE